MPSKNEMSNYTWAPISKAECEHSKRNNLLLDMMRLSTNNDPKIIKSVEKRYSEHMQKGV